MSKSSSSQIQSTVFSSPSNRNNIIASRTAHPHHLQQESTSQPPDSLGPLPAWFPPHTHGHPFVGATPAQNYPFNVRNQAVHPSPYPLTNSAQVSLTYAEVPTFLDDAGRGTDKATSIQRATSSIKRDNPESGVGAKDETMTSANKMVSPPSGEDEEVEDKGASNRKGKKRRRVVVACDTCRRKKVKCEGLPNATNTCNNCLNMGYSCNFTVEPDRSRGRYEILEAQKDTILAALRSVAPEMAEQFDKGELSMSNLSGATTRKQEQEMAEDDLVRSQNVGSSRLLEAGESVPTSEHDSFTLPREPKQDLGPMIPDLEDGRPRYFGGSSNLTTFHNLDSRPPSPGLGNRNARLVVTGDGNRDRDAGDAQINNGVKSTMEHTNSLNRLAVLPRPRPQYPSNSLGWVRHVRKKTLVAVGRDDNYGVDGWFQRFPFPEAGLLNELLDLFFQQLNPLFPIIHEHSLRRDLAQGRAEKDSAFRGLIFTIISIASRFLPNDSRVLDDKDDPNSAGDHWAAASRFHHQVYAASLINVQVLLLSTTFMPASLGVGTSWTVLGVAIRALQDIGLHTEKAYSDYSPFEQEMRRRTFWAAFILDGILSINMGRPSALRLADTSVNFPLLATEEALTRADLSSGPIEEQASFDSRPCPAAGFIHLIKLTFIAQDVVNTLYAPRWKHDSGPNLGSKSYTTIHQRSPATYKDMTILSQRLDEWVSKIPAHLQSIQDSPYKEQAGMLQCGRHDIRLYILKPFLQDGKPAFSQSTDRGNVAMQEGSILRKMLLPQCINHARECLKLFRPLPWQDGQSNHMVFIRQQAFLSAATFMLTIWHGTTDVKALSKDNDLIEATLSMLRPEENRYCSALLRRAQRILCNIAQRSLLGMTDEAQKKRVQDLIELHGVQTKAPATKLFGGVNHNEKENQLRQSIENEGGKSVHPSKEGMPIGAAENILLDKWGGPLWGFTPSDAHEGKVDSNEMTATASSSFTTMPSNQNHTHANHHPSTLDHHQQHPNLSQDATSIKTREEPLDVSQDWLAFADPFSSAARNDPSEIPHGFEFTTDLSWTDYFSKFLGGLPNPGNSPITSAMSPIVVNKTP